MKQMLGSLRRRLRGRLAREVAGAGSGRRALLLYSVDAFRRGPDRHQNVSQQRMLAEALGERGHAVDVIDWNERAAGVLRGPYDVVVDLHPASRPVYEDHLVPNAVRIAYITGSNPEFANAAERARLAALEQRRGVVLQPRRQTPPFPPGSLERCDSLFLIGGRATLATYAGRALPPTHVLPNSAFDVEPTDFSRRDPARFLFLGSMGQVHKGLDRLLEVFGEAAQLSLVVCSRTSGEPDFARAYRMELTRLPNVRVAGFMDLKSREFRELQSTCGTMILPSCAEGQSGTVTVALAHGLPCIVSRECGFDDPEISVLGDCEIATIAQEVRRRAAEPRSTLARRAADALACYRARYRPEHYRLAVARALDATLPRMNIGRVQ